MDWRDGVEVLALELDVRSVSLAVCNVYQKQRHVQGTRKLLAPTDHWSLLVAGDYNDPTQPCSQCLPPTRRAATRQCSSSTSTTSGSSTPGSPPTRGERADHTNESGDLTPGATWHVQPTLTSDPYATIINYSIAPPPPRKDIRKADWARFQAVLDKCWASTGRRASVGGGERRLSSIGQPTPPSPGPPQATAIPRTSHDTAIPRTSHDATIPRTSHDAAIPRTSPGRRRRPDSCSYCKESSTTGDGSGLGLSSTYDKTM